MNAEHLLDAVGQLDDDLIREAETYRRAKPRGHYGTWLSWAASVAVVLALGYGAIQLGMFSKGGGSAAPAAPSGNGVSTPAASTPASSAPAGGEDNSLMPPGEGSGLESPGAPAQGADGDASHDMRSEVFSVSLKMDEPMNRLWYTFQHWYGKDRTLEELPEGCVSLGKVEDLSETEEAGVPYTDSEEFVGCQAWLLREDPVEKKFKLYVELPEGGYLECR